MVAAVNTTKYTIENDLTKNEKKKKKKKRKKRKKNKRTFKQMARTYLKQNIL